MKALLQSARPQLLSQFAFGGSAKVSNKHVRRVALSRKPKAICALKCAVSDASTFYTVLGVNVDASSNDIKYAYRQMARRYHPDVNPLEARDECTKKFIEVQNAYETLSNPTMKEEYDYALRNSVSTQTYAKSSRGWGNQYSQQSRHPFNPGWEFQLTRLKQGYRMSSQNHEAPTDTWGARMRQKNSSWTYA